MYLWTPVLASNYCLVFLLLHSTNIFWLFWQFNEGQVSVFWFETVQLICTVVSFTSWSISNYTMPLSRRHTYTHTYTLTFTHTHTLTSWHTHTGHTPSILQKVLIIYVCSLAWRLKNLFLSFWTLLDLTKIQFNTKTKPPKRFSFKFNFWDNRSIFLFSIFLL